MLFSNSFREQCRRIVLTEKPRLYAVGLAWVVFGLLLPVAGRPFILGDGAATLFGLIGPGYDRPGSDMTIYMRAGDCWRAGVPVWTPLCNPYMIPNLLPAPLLLVVPFTAHHHWGQPLLFGLLWLALYGGLLALPFRRHAAGLLAAASLIYLPGFLIGMRSGNMEVFCFCLVAWACRFDQKRAAPHALPAILIALASCYKIYTAIILVVLRDRLAAFAIALLLGLYFVIYRAVVVNAFMTTVYGYENTFGLVYHYGYVNRMAPVMVWFAPTLLGFRDVLTWLYLKDPRSAWLWQILLPAIILTLLPAALAALRYATRRPYYDYDTLKGRFLIAGCLLILPVIGLFWNFSYRYWVVFLIVPQLFEEAFAASRGRRFWLNLIALLAVYLGGLMQYKLQPQPAWVPEEYGVVYFSIRHVLQYYAELILTIFALTVNINWLTCIFWPQARRVACEKWRSLRKPS